MENGSFIEAIPGPQGTQAMPLQYVDYVEPGVDSSGCHVRRSLNITETRPSKLNISHGSQFKVQTVSY